MSASRLVTVVGATGQQGGAVVRSLVATGKYKIRGLTRDVNSSKAQAVKKLDDRIEMVQCDLNNSDDVKKAFDGSWAVFGLTDFWAQPDKPEVELKQGQLMADVVATLKIPYFIFSALEDPNKQSNGKLNVPHFTHKAQIRDYIKKTYPDMKAIFVEPGYYMQNWAGVFKPPPLPDGTILFAAPIDEKVKLHMADIEDTGPIVREILSNPDKFVHHDICICGDEIAFGDIPKVFTKVTGKKAIAKSLTEEEFRGFLQHMPKFIQDEMVDMYKWFEKYGYYGKDKDWTTGKQVTRLNTFEDWLKKTGWKGE